MVSVGAESGLFFTTRRLGEPPGLRFHSVHEVQVFGDADYKG